MSIKARLKNGDLLVEGEVNERLPVVTDGLVAHYPFDNTSEGFMKRNLLDTSHWVIGRKGTQGMFTINGSLAENDVVMYENPWGKVEPTWASLGNDSLSDADGGWNVTGRSINNSEKYRLSVWTKRTDVGDGRTYFGCQGDTVTSLGTTVVNTNPYFGAYLASDLPQIENNWTLWVAYIHPHNYAGGTDSKSGVYDVMGNKLKSLTDFKWTPTTTVGGHRTYQYYSTSVNEKHYWSTPRFEICDGTEPTLQDLLNGRDITYPTVNTNTNLSSEGITVENGTTNLWTGGLNVYNNYRTTTTDELIILNETYMGQPVYRLSMRVNDINTLNHFRSSLSGHGVIGGSQQWTEGKKYASSIYWRSVNKADTVFGGVASNTSGWSPGTTEYLKDGWRRYFRYRTGVGVATRLDSIHHSFCCPSLELNETIMIDFTCPQTEEGRIFPTSYTTTTRGDGSLEIPFKLKPPYSINLWHKPYVTLKSIESQTSSPMILQLGRYHDNASISLWNFNKKLTVYAKGDIGTTWSGTSPLRNYTDLEWDNKEHMYTLVMSTNRKIKVYMDGKYQGEVNSSVDITEISRLEFSTNYKPDAIYRDLSIYEKELNETEIGKLYENTFSLTNKGDLITNMMDEKSVGIPIDVVHIPLGETSADQLSLVKPSSESNTVYQNGAVWIGTATQNRYEYPTFETDVSSGGWSHWGNVGHKGSFGQNTDREFILSPSNTYSHWVENGIGAENDYLIFQSPSFTGGFRSLSAILCMSDGSEITSSTVYPVRNGGNGGTPNSRWTSIERIGSSKWYLCKAEGLSVDGSNNLVGIYIKPGVRIYIDSIQLEDKPFSSPFTSSSRVSTDLEFNLHRDLELDWSKDWSIAYWKKPVGTQNNLLTGYNIDSLGSNGNSEGGGYTWMGKNSGVDSNTRPSFPIDPNTYFNEWHLVSVVRKGNTITYGNRNKNGVFEEVNTILISRPNHYVCQHGYDLKLGGWDNINANNSWFRDLIVAKREMTSVELDVIYSTQMRTNATGTKVQSQIKENQILR